MPNKDVVNGFKPVQHLDGSPFNGKVNMYLLPSTNGTATFIGDAVKSGGTAGAAGVTVYGQDVEGMPTIAQAAATDTLRGVVVGFLPNQTNLEQRHRVSSQNRIALVVDSPNVIFEIQEDSVGGALAATAVGANVDVVVAAGNTTTGLSGMEIDSSGVETSTTSAQLRILGMVKKPDNALGTNAKWLVVINEHELKSTTGV